MIEDPLDGQKNYFHNPRVNSLFYSIEPHWFIEIRLRRKILLFSTHASVNNFPPERTRNDKPLPAFRSPPDCQTEAPKITEPYSGQLPRPALCTSCWYHTGPGLFQLAQSNLKRRLVFTLLGNGVLFPRTSRQRRLSIDN